MWPYEHPLAQICSLHADTLNNIHQYADDTEIAEFRAMEPKEVGTLLRMNEQHGMAVRNAALRFPTVALEYALRPLSHDILQINVHIAPSFDWNARLSGTNEPFYIWIEDEERLNILSWRSVLLRPTTKGLDLEFVITLGDTLPWSFNLVAASDRWLGSDDTRAISLEGLTMPDPPPESTTLLEIPYLSISSFADQHLENSYKSYISTLNNIQSQAFWSLYHTNHNVLISAPVSSGKSFLGEGAIWYVDHPQNRPEAKRQLTLS